jgi:hypothetical protein
MTDTKSANGPQHGAGCTKQSHLHDPAALAGQAALIAAGVQAAAGRQAVPPAAARQQGCRAAVGWQLPWHPRVHHRHQGMLQREGQHALHCYQVNAFDQPAAHK